jgi:hypothetical protein
MGQGFFQIMCKGEASAQKLLMRTPHHSRWGTCILQPWCAGFNPRKPEKMRMPVWVTLKDVPGEFRSSAIDIAESLGPVLGKNRSNVQQNDQKFCVALTTGDPFPITVEVINPVNGKPSLIAVDYNNLPIRYRHCLSTNYLVKDCPALSGRVTPEESTAAGIEGKSNVGAGGASGASPATEKSTEAGSEMRPEIQPEVTPSEVERRRQEQRGEGEQHSADPKNHKSNKVAARISPQDRITSTSIDRDRVTRIGGRERQGVMPPSGFSSSSTSTDQGSGREKHPNPSFKGVRQAETVTSHQGGDLNMATQIVQEGMNVGSQQQGLS